MTRTIHAPGLAADSTPVDGGAAASVSREVVFSQPGGARVRLGESGSYDVSPAVTFQSVVLTLTVAGTSDTSVQILRNGSVVATVTIDAVATELAVSTGSLVFSNHDNLSVACSAAGTGARGLVAVIREALPEPAPAVTGTAGGTSYGVAPDATGQYVFAASPFDDTFRVFNVTNPLAPTQATTLVDGTQLNGVNHDMFVVGSLCYIHRAEGVAIVDVTNPLSPAVVTTTIDTGYSNVGGMGTNGSCIVYGVRDSVDDTDGIRVANMSGTPVGGIVSGGVHSLYRARGQIVVEGDLAYVAKYQGFAIVDVSTPASPSVVVSVSDSTKIWTDSNALAKIGDYLYVGDTDSTSLQGAGGVPGEGRAQIHVYDVSVPSTPVFVTTLERTGTIVGPSRFFVYGDLLVVADGSDNYPVGSLDDYWGVVIIDVSDPANPWIRSHTHATSGGLFQAQFLCWTGVDNYFALGRTTAGFSVIDLLA